MHISLFKNNQGEQSKMRGPRETVKRIMPVSTKISQTKINVQQKVPWKRHKQLGRAKERQKQELTDWNRKGCFDLNCVYTSKSEVIFLSFGVVG